MKRRGFIKNSALIFAGLPVKNLQFNNFISKKNTTKIRVGVIGCGVRGNYLIKILQEKINGAEVTACCDIYEPNLQKGLSLLSQKATGYRDYRAIIDNQEIDAVVIATPLHLHFSMAIDAINARKHIYCEKTMCYDIPQSIELFQKVNASKFTFQVGYQQRTNPLFHKVYDLIKNGWCGEITHIDCAWNRNGNWRRPVDNPDYERLINWRMYREYSGGLMTELCSHQIDIVNFLLEAHPLKVSGFGGIDYWKDGRETFDNVNVIFEYPKGLKARFSSITTNAHEGFYVKIYGTKATVEVNRQDGQSGYIYPERPPETLLNFQVDGVTGATQEAWDRQEGIPIRIDGPTDDEASTSNALSSFIASIGNGERPKADVHSGYLTSISAHMANNAMYNEHAEIWKDQYDIMP